MRIWSLHPSLLDRAGLTACWRESLLAQAVLAGRTKGYRNHPQLSRFRATADPLASIGSYLSGIADEAERRGYNFDRTRIDRPQGLVKIDVTDEQVAFERAHLEAKLANRAPERLPLTEPGEPTPTHPIFIVTTGPIADWERP